MKKTAVALMLILLFSVPVVALFIDVGESTIPNPVEDSPIVGARILSPKSGTYLTNPVNLTIKGDCHLYPVHCIEYSVDNGSWVVLYKYGDLVGPLSVTESVLLNLSDGFHRVDAKVTAMGYSDFWYETFKVDTVPPRLSVFSPENKTYGMSDVQLNFTVYEPDSPLSKTEYSLDGLDNVTITGNTTLTGIPYGEHNVTVFATDEVGNTGASETLFFTIEESPEPFPTLLVATASIIIIVVVFAVFLLMRKRKH